VAVVGVGAITAGVTAYGLLKNDGWMPDEDDSVLMAPGPLRTNPTTKILPNSTPAGVHDE